MSWSPARPILRTVQTAFCGCDNGSDVLALDSIPIRPFREDNLTSTLIIALFNRYSLYPALNTTRLDISATLSHPYNKVRSRRKILLCIGDTQDTSPSPHTGLRPSLPLPLVNHGNSRRPQALDQGVQDHLREPPTVHQRSSFRIKHLGMALHPYWPTWHPLR